MSFPTSLVVAIFMLHYLPVLDSVIFYMCCDTANMKELLHLDLRSESSFLSDVFRNWKNALCKTKGFCKHESSLCQKYAVTLLTQSGHADEQLKERHKCQKEEYRNGFLKVVQRISYPSCLVHALHKGKEDEESNFKQLLLRAEDNEELRKWIQSI